jgi:putative ABC transport system permease protein
METLWQDVKFGTRMLLKHRGVTLVAILTLALGIGANTTMFSVVHAVLLRPLPYPQPEQLVMVWEDWTRRQGPDDEWTNPANFYDWQQQSKSFSHLAAFTGWGPTLTGMDEPEQLQGLAVTHQWLSLLGGSPALGRDFLAEEDRPGGANVVIISHGLWQRRFGGDRGVLDKVIQLNATPFTIIGVLPQGFRVPVSPNLEVLGLLQSAPGRARGNAIWRVVGRLRPDVTIAQAQSEIRGIAGRLEQQYPETNTGIGIRLVPLQEQLTGPVQKAMWTLFGAVTFVLLIACVNVANLLLARAASRQREVAIRLALGAGRIRLLRQLLTESVLLAMVSGAAGLLLALWSLDAVRAGLPSPLASFVSLQLDVPVLAFTLAATIATGLLFGMIPAAQVARQALAESLKEGARTGSGTMGSGRAGRSLLVVEVALALVLLVGAGLLLKSFSNLTAVDPGFRTENILTGQIVLPRARYAEPSQISAFHQRLLERLGNTPGLERSALISTLPLSGVNSDTDFRIQGRPDPPPGQSQAVWFRQVSPAYLETMGIAIRAGRAFDDRDATEAPRVIIVNESFVRKYFPDENPLGQRIGSGGPQSPQWMEIVGVAGNVHNFGLEKEEPPAAYLPLAQFSSRRVFVVVRTAGRPLDSAPTLRAVVRELDRDLPLNAVTTMEELLGRSVAQPRFQTSLLAGFAALALVLAAVGIFGVMSCNVSQRTQEMGVRLALGAQPRDVLALVLRQGMLLAGLGMAIGLAAALALGQSIRSLLFQVDAADPATLSAVAVLLAVVALAACWIPARRATRVDPLAALRYE